MTRQKAAERVPVHDAPSLTVRCDEGGTRRTLVVKGHQDTRVTITVEACRGKVWLTSFDCPFVSEAILEPAQADGLVELITQTAREVRSRKNGPAS